MYAKRKRKSNATSSTSQFERHFFTFLVVFAFSRYPQQQQECAARRSAHSEPGQDISTQQLKRAKITAQPLHCARSPCRRGYHTKRTVLKTAKGCAIQCFKILNVAINICIHISIDTYTTIPMRCRTACMSMQQSALVVPIHLSKDIVSELHQKHTVASGYKV